VTRRDTLKIGGLILASGLAATTGFLTLSNDINTPVVKFISVPITGLKPGLEGFTIAQLSDIHLEPYTKIALIERAVDMINQLHPDVVVLTGDYVWRWADAAFELAPALAKLNPRLGIYAVMGNHDYWTGIRAVESAFAEARLPVLYNQGLVLSSGNAQLYLAGLDDGWSGKPDLSAALANVPLDIPVVLLYHEPDLADEVARESRVALQLSGHTHGGQMRIPGPIVLPYLGKKYEYGLYRVSEDMQVYTNAGLGTISLPLRYNCPPEITLITLISPD